MSAEVAGHTADTVATQSTAQPRQQDDLSRIGKYQVLPAMLGDGGFCSLYKCKYPGANSGTVTVAVKLSTCPVSIHDNAQWESYRREWQTYQNLSFGRTAESHSAGIPAVYECGLVRTKVGIHTWISMQLLGPDVRTLAFHSQIKLQADFLHLATGMLAALQHVHSTGIVHRDIKPANFCVGADSEGDKVFIVDFGFASHVPSKERAAQDRAYCQVAFAGTPDYASRDALRGIRCSPKDDLESLGYCFLEMLYGDLPWYLTEEKSFEGPNCFSHEQLCQMADDREASWQELCDTEQIPDFLVSWHEYVRSLSMYETPSYKWLRRLLQHAPTPEPHKFKHSSDNAAAEDVSATKKQKLDHGVPEE